MSRSVWARSFSAERPAQHPHVLARGARGGLGQPDLGELGIGVGDPGQRPVIDLGGQPEQRVPDHDPGMVERDMGELRSAGDIADGKGAAVGGAQPGIDGDPFCGRLDPRGGEVERFDASGGGRRRPADATR